VVVAESERGLSLKIFLVHHIVFLLHQSLLLIYRHLPLDTGMHNMQNLVLTHSADF